jgi:hypothetical protein
MDRLVLGQHLEDGREAAVHWMARALEVVQSDTSVLFQVLLAREDQLVLSVLMVD